MSVPVRLPLQMVQASRAGFDNLAICVPGWLFVTELRPSSEKLVVGNRLSLKRVLETLRAHEGRVAAAWSGARSSVRFGGMSRRTRGKRYRCASGALREQADRHF